MTTIRLRQHGVLKWLFAGSLALITLLCTLMIVERASAHGYVQSPGSRAYLCKTGANTNCGPIVYEPQSLEAPKAFLPQARQTVKSPAPMELFQRWMNNLRPAGARLTSLQAHIPSVGL